MITYKLDEALYILIFENLSIMAKLVSFIVPLFIFIYVLLSVCLNSQIIIHCINYFFLLLEAEKESANIV